jgi:hypothetical protein
MKTSTGKIDGPTFPDRPDLAFADQWEGWHKFLGLEGSEWASAYHVAAHKVAIVERGPKADFALQAGPAAERRFRSETFEPDNEAEKWVANRLVWAKIEAVASSIREHGSQDDHEVRTILRQVEEDLQPTEAGG